MQFYVKKLIMPSNQICSNLLVNWPLLENINWTDSTLSVIQICCTSLVFPFSLLQSISKWSHLAVSQRTWVRNEQWIYSQNKVWLKSNMVLWVTRFNINCSKFQLSSWDIKFHVKLLKILQFLKCIYHSLFSMSLLIQILKGT